MSLSDEQGEQIRDVLDGHTPVGSINGLAGSVDHVLASHLTIEAAWREHLYRCRYRAQLAAYRTTALQQLLNLALDGGDETVRKACVDLIRAAQAELDQPLTTPEALDQSDAANNAQAMRAHLQWFLTATEVDNDLPGEGGER